MRRATLHLGAIRKLADEPGSNVAVLPTAAPRKVQQASDAGSIRARYEAYREKPFPRDPRQRRQRERMDLLEDLTPEMIVAIGIFDALGPRQRNAAFHAVCRRLQEFPTDVTRKAFDALMKHPEH